jgi:hypothetical protein
LSFFLSMEDMVSSITKKVSKSISRSEKVTIHILGFTVEPSVLRFFFAITTKKA